MEKNLKYLKHLDSIDKSLQGILKELKKSRHKNARRQEEEVAEIIETGVINLNNNMLER